MEKIHDECFLWKRGWEMRDENKENFSLIRIVLLFYKKKKFKAKNMNS